MDGHSDHGKDDAKDGAQAGARAAVGAEHPLKREDAKQGRSQTASATPAGRRGFLVGAGAAAGMAGAAAATFRRPLGPVADVAAEQAQKDPVQGKGYHETPHIRKYYDTTKV
jgi:hypothetical protein